MIDDEAGESKGLEGPAYLTEEKANHSYTHSLISYSAPLKSRGY